MNRQDLSEKCDLYFVRAERGAVKIGRSTNVRARYKALRCASSDELSLIGIVPGCGWQERAWHFALREDHVRGEWFAWTPELREAIKLAIAGLDWTLALEEYDAFDAEMALSALIYAHDPEWFAGGVTPTGLRKVNDFNG